LIHGPASPPGFDFGEYLAHGCSIYRKPDDFATFLAMEYREIGTSGIKASAVVQQHASGVV
jgi:hypothetical protein